MSYCKTQPVFFCYNPGAVHILTHISLYLHHLPWAHTYALNGWVTLYAHLKVCDIWDTPEMWWLCTSMYPCPISSHFCPNTLLIITKLASENDASFPFLLIMTFRWGFPRFLQHLTSFEKNCFSWSNFSIVKLFYVLKILTFWLLCPKHFSSASHLFHSIWDFYHHRHKLISLLHSSFFFSFGLVSLKRPSSS